MRNRGTQREIIRKRHKNNNKAGIKLSGAILSIWEMAGKNLSVPHSQQDWCKSSQPSRCTYNLQPDLLGSFPADIIGQFGRGHRAKFSPSVEGGGKKFLTNSTCTYTSYSRHEITLNTLNCLFPSNTLLPRNLIFLKSPSQQKFGWRTDVLRNRSILWRKSRMVIKFGPYVVLMIKGAVSRQSSSFCLILPITHPQSLWNLK